MFGTLDLDGLVYADRKSRVSQNYNPSLVSGKHVEIDFEELVTSQEKVDAAIAAGKKVTRGRRVKTAGRRISDVLGESTIIWESGRELPPKAPGL